jgi:hypothetical protein
VTLFAVQGGMLMPIKVGGCSRSLAKQNIVTI